MNNNRIIIVVFLIFCIVGGGYLSFVEISSINDNVHNFINYIYNDSSIADIFNNVSTYSNGDISFDYPMN